MNNPETVLLLNSLFIPNVGGVENSLKSIAEEFKKRGKRVILVCSDRNYINDNTLLKREKLLDLEVYRYHYPTSRFGFFLQLFYCIRILIVIKKTNTGRMRVISRNAITTVCAFFAGFRGVDFIPPQVSLYKDAKISTFLSPRGFVKYLFEVFSQFLSFCVSGRVLVFSEIMQSQVKAATFGIRSPLLVSPGVNLNRFKILPSEDVLRRRQSLGLPEKASISLALGRFSEVKRFDLAIEAFSHLDENHILLLVGEGPERRRYEEIIRDFSLTDRVYIFPATEEPEFFYSVSDQFLMTSRYESFGQVLLEATASGLPIVALPPRERRMTAVSSLYKGYPNLILYTNSESPTDVASGIKMCSSRHKDKHFLLDRDNFIIKFSWSRFVDEVAEN